MTARRSFAALVLAAASLTVTAQPPDSGGFRYERSITTAGAGPYRLAVDLQLLAGAERFRTSGDVALDGLADLRLFTPSGRTVPYLLVHPPYHQTSWISTTVLPVPQTEKSSGFEADLGAVQLMDAIDIGGLPQPLLKRFELHASTDRERWVVLEREGTLFDLPQEALRRTEVEFAPGQYRYLRVTWDDTNSGRVGVPSYVRARQTTLAAPIEPLQIRLPLERRPSEPGRSRYRIRLPAARLPIVALEVDLPPQHVYRDATVQGTRLMGNALGSTWLGSGHLRQVVGPAGIAAERQIQIQPSDNRELDLVIDDGQNAPLELRTVTAVFARLPWIYFEAPGGRVVARYGRRNSPPPSYDLEAARASLDILAVPDASWSGDPALEAAASPGSAPPEPGLGATIDTDSFAYARTVAAPVSPGLVSVALDAEVLAHSRGRHGRFSDLRVVTVSSEQVPYLMERLDEPMPIDVQLTRLAEPPGGVEPGTSGRSYYRFELPYGGLPEARLVLETPARVFERRVRAGIERPPDRRHRDAWLESVAEAEWYHGSHEQPAPAVLLSLGDLDATTIIVTVEEGDNSPLPITSARLLVPAQRIRFFHPGGDAVRLVYGRRDLPRPQYDLALLASHVLESEARELALSEPSAARHVQPGAAFISPAAFWALLGTAVLVLLGLIARVVRSTDGEAEPR